MINVLLVSPRLPPTDNRYCGDNAYTDTLLQHPPPGVRYHHYEDLLASGRARRIRTLQALTYYLTRAGVLSPDMWFEAIETDFVPDILHIYGFSAVVRFPRPVRLQPPTILGAGTGSYSDLKYYRGWDDKPISRARWLKRQYLRIIGAHDSSLRPERSKRIHVWSRFSQKMHLDEGRVAPQQITVLYPGIHIENQPSRLDVRNETGTTFLFVANAAETSFELKGGRLVLEAFQRLRRHIPNIRLVIVGNPPKEYKVEGDGIVYSGFVPRHVLFERIYPQADIFVAPRKGEGFGLALVEALAHGLPVIGANAWAIPEIIVNGENGYFVTPGNLDELVECMECFIDQPDRLLYMRQQSLRIFRERFSLEAHNDRLAKMYRELIAS